MLNPKSTAQNKICNPFQIKVCIFKIYPKVLIVYQNVNFSYTRVNHKAHQYN